MAGVLRSRGAATRGLRGVIASTLPIAAGLSSSAALEIAVAWALAGGEEAPLAPLDLARAGQDVENGFIGLQSGLMDQLAVVFGREDAALLIDCRSFERRPVRLSLERHAIVAVDSGSPRRLNASGYNERRAACEAVVASLGASRPGIRALRDVTLEMLDEARGDLGPTAAARAEHVIRENARVLACADALEAGDLATVGTLLAASHASLRDLYEVSSSELDALVELAVDVPGVAGARMTGAGFGGSIVVIVERGSIETLRGTIADAYSGRTGRTATLHEVAPARGAGPITPAA
jgi:galactokinase